MILPRLGIITIIRISYKPNLCGGFKLFFFKKSLLLLEEMIQLGLNISQNGLVFHHLRTRFFVFLRMEIPRTNSGRKRLQVHLQVLPLEIGKKSIRRFTNRRAKCAPQLGTTNFAPFVKKWVVCLKGR